MKKVLYVAILAVCVCAMVASAQETAPAAPAQEAPPCHILSIRGNQMMTCSCAADCDKCGEIKVGQCVCGKDGPCACGKCACGKDVVTTDLTGKFVCGPCKVISDAAGKCPKCGTDLAEAVAPAKAPACCGGKGEACGAVAPAGADSTPPVPDAGK